jgi:hypothetical protein
MKNFYDYLEIIQEEKQNYDEAWKGYRLAKAAVQEIGAEVVGKLEDLGEKIGIKKSLVSARTKIKIKDNSYKRIDLKSLYLLTDGEMYIKGDEEQVKFVEFFNTFGANIIVKKSPNFFKDKEGYEKTLSYRQAMINKNFKIIFKNIIELVESNFSSKIKYDDFNDKNQKRFDKIKKTQYKGFIISVDKDCIITIKLIN